MSSLLAKMVGQRGNLVTRHGSKESGMHSSVQSFTAAVSQQWEWDVNARVWNVTITRSGLTLRSRDATEVLWQGTVSE